MHHQSLWHWGKYEQYKNVNTIGILSESNECCQCPITFIIIPTPLFKSWKQNNSCFLMALNCIKTTVDWTENNMDNSFDNYARIS